MDTARGGRSPAEVYDERFVPALFAQWAPVVADAARIAPGQRVLDVACGTGALTLVAAARAGEGGRVVGLDASPEMLAVARRKSGAIEWREGAAERLPFDGERFDAAVSQFGLMFFEDRARALAEMMRVLRPGGRLALAVCGPLDRAPGYAELADLLDRIFGRAIGDAFRAPFCLGDAALLAGIARAAGIAGARVVGRDGEVSFGSIGDLVATERACAWTLGGMLDDEQFERLHAAAEDALAPFRAADGRVRFALQALILTAAKPR